jgi:hypothetical protein
MTRRSQPVLTFAGLVAVIGAALLCASFAAGETTKRLILKDGSYQAVTKYEVQGDRVRYRSADRSEWEELPKDLIDWKATEEFNAGRASAVESPEARELDKELEAELKAEEAGTPEVAPGLRLPEGGGVILLDTFKSEPQLVEISQNGGELNRNLGKNIFRGALNPVASQKQSVELQGLHASVQSHQARPVIFISPPPEDASAVGKTAANEAAQPKLEQNPDRFRIVHADVKKTTRSVGSVKIAISGKMSQEQKFIETKNEPISGGWIRLTPLRDLEPGEYAVVEMLGKEGMNLYVWDFGVNPNAPANLSAWKAIPAKQPTKPTDPAKLEKRN